MAYEYKLSGTLFDYFHMVILILYIILHFRGRVCNLFHFFFYIYPADTFTYKTCALLIRYILHFLLAVVISPAHTGH